MLENGLARCTGGSTRPARNVDFRCDSRWGGDRHGLRHGTDGLDRWGGAGGGSAGKGESMIDGLTRGEEEVTGKGKDPVVGAWCGFYRRRRWLGAVGDAGSEERSSPKGLSGAIRRRVSVEIRWAELLRIRGGEGLTPWRWWLASREGRHREGSWWCEVMDETGARGGGAGERGDGSTKRRDGGNLGREKMDPVTSRGDHVEGLIGTEAVTNRGEENGCCSWSLGGRPWKKLAVEGRRLIDEDRGNRWPDLGGEGFDLMEGGAAEGLGMGLVQRRASGLDGMPWDETTMEEGWRGFYWSVKVVTGERWFGGFGDG